MPSRFRWSTTKNSLLSQATSCGTCHTCHDHTFVFSSFMIAHASGSYFYGGPGFAHKNTTTQVDRLLSRHPPLDVRRVLPPPRNPSPYPQTKLLYILQQFLWSLFDIFQCAAKIVDTGERDEQLGSVPDQLCTSFHPPRISTDRFCGNVL